MMTDGQGQVTRPAGVDVGWFATKTALNSETTSFPSLAAPTPANYGLADIGTLGSALPYQITHPWSMLIGRAAYAQGIGSPDLTPEWVLGDAYKALVLTALAGDTLAPHLSYKVVLGLPVSYMGLKGQLEEAMRGGHQVKFAGRKQTQTIKINAFIVAQGIGALATTLIDRNGFMSDEQMERIENVETAPLYAVIDCGSGSCCYIQSRGLRPVDEGTRSTKIAAWEIERRCREALAEKFGPTLVEDLGRHELMRKLRTRTLKDQGTPVDTAPIWNAALDAVAIEVVHTARSLWGDGRSIERIVLAGGGSMLLADRITRMYPHANIGLPIDVDPVFANAIGFKRLAAMMLKAETD